MWTVLAVLLMCSHAHGTPRLDPIVDTNAGLIKGLKNEDERYYKFLGIPYAKVDKANPFGVALPYPRFETVFEAYNDSAVCPQKGFSGKVEGTLDCLNLNIFVPQGASIRNRMPVLVWIHGGGFELGSGTETVGKSILENNVLLVTINYRLGPYGFMCLDTPEVPGNQGFKDQYKALEWIKSNILAFGGDANKITVMGESAGSMSIDFHLLAQKPKLFQQAILQSGTSLTPDVVVPSDRTVPLKLAKHLGYETEDMAAAMSFLVTTNELLVIAASKELEMDSRACVEKKFDGVENFVSEHPERIKADIKNMPILQGYNSHEETNAYINMSPDEFKVVKPFEKDLKVVFDFGDDYDKMEDIVRHFYIGDKVISENVKWELIDFASDYTFVYPTQRSLERYLRNGAQNIYHYMFSYNGNRHDGMTPIFNVTTRGASHGAELSYLFDLSSEADTTPSDQLVEDRLTTMWTNFVKYGNPTPEVTELLPVKWLPLTQSTFYYLAIDTNLTLSTRPYHQRLTFWDVFYTWNNDRIIANIH